MCRIPVSIGLWMSFRPFSKSAPFSNHLNITTHPYQLPTCLALTNRTTLRNLRRTASSADRNARQFIRRTEFTRTSRSEEMKKETTPFNCDMCQKWLLVARGKDSFELLLLHNVYSSCYVAGIFNFCSLHAFQFNVWIPFLQKSWTSLRAVIRTQVTWPLPVIWYTSWGAESVIVATNTKWSQ
jgi:hypothetical protein